MVAHGRQYTDHGIGSGYIISINESEDSMQPYGSYPVRKALYPVSNTTHPDYRGLHTKGAKARARRLAKRFIQLVLREGKE
jgi:hypothetical protein